MDLDEFISETIKQLINGIKESQKYAVETGAGVNPRGLNYLGESNKRIQHKETTRIGEEIEFDIEVTSTEGTQKSGRAGISVAFFGMGGKGQSCVENRSVNRIKFKVPIIFPKMDFKEDS